MMRNKQSGQVLVSAALMLVLLLGCAGLGIDMGVLRYEKRMQQTAADGAAIAAATNLAPYTGYQTGALNASATNGYTDNTGGGACVTPPTDLAVGSVTVTVCTPPSTGPHSGQAHYVEAFVSAGQPTYFMRIFGVTRKTITARAVATNSSGGTLGTSTGCLYTLGPPSSSVEGVNINGNATLNAPSCGIVDNGNFNTSGQLTGCACQYLWRVRKREPERPRRDGNVHRVCDVSDLRHPRLRRPVGFAHSSNCGNSCEFGPALLFQEQLTMELIVTGNGTVNFPAGTYILSGGSFTCHGTPTITGTRSYVLFHKRSDIQLHRQ